MKITYRLATLLFTVAGLTVGTDLGAQQASAPAAALVDNMPNFREAYLAQLLAPFRAATGTTQALTADDVKKARQIAAAGARAQALMAFFSADLDADGRVTLDEYRTRQRGYWPSTMNSSASDQLTKQFAQMDGNGDGVVTFDEAMAAAVRAADAQAGRVNGGNRLEQLLALDPNHDGALTADELEQLGRAAFAFYDRNGDGVLSDDERKIQASDSAASRQAGWLREQYSRCNFPHADANESVLLIDVLKASALSSVSLVGQDRVTETAELFIEPGDTPLYILALGRLPVIWRLTGDVKRVTHFVAASTQPALGVIGLPKAAVTLSPSLTCVNGRTLDNAAGARQTASALEQTIGRPLRGIVSQGFFKMQLPSGATAPEQIADARAQPAVIAPQGEVPATPTGVDEETNAAFWRSHPGGLVQIDAAEVLATRPAVAYDLPPMEAGLMKLMADGAISRIGTRNYLINRQIAQIPAGLMGPSAVHFALAPGVTLPPGYPPRQPMAPNDFRDGLPKKF
jgi:hypothetical protein